MNTLAAQAIFFNAKREKHSQTSDSHAQSSDTNYEKFNQTNL